MSEFVDDADVIEVHAPWWAKDESVILRRIMSEADETATKNAMFQIKREGKDVDLQQELGSMRTVLLHRMIVSWTLKDNKGQVVPVTLTSIKKLSARTATFLEEAIEANNPSLTDEERKSFLGL